MSPTAFHESPFGRLRKRESPGEWKSSIRWRLEEKRPFTWNGNGGFLVDEFRWEEGEGGADDVDAEVEEADYVLSELETKLMDEAAVGLRSDVHPVHNDRLQRLVSPDLRRMGRILNESLMTKHNDNSQVKSICFIGNQTNVYKIEINNALIEHDTLNCIQ